MKMVWSSREFINFKEFLGAYFVVVVDLANGSFKPAQKTLI